MQRLREKRSAGVVDDSAQCTADNGDTWVSLGHLIGKDSEPDGAASRPENGQNSESVTISQSETTVDLSPESTDDSDRTDQGVRSRSRRLRRLPAGSGTGKLARLLTTREPQKSAGVISGPEDLIGASLANGRYEIVDQLGKGSMAYVLRAWDSRLLTDVVVKVPKPEKMTDNDIRDRFRRESQLLVQLTHPHVVKVLDVGEYNDLPYVVMQLLSGGTLTDRIRKESTDKKGMPPDSLKSWLREVARALDFCYRKGMVHRDIKPANILFDEDENAYVSDFGLTKIMYGEYDNIDPSETAAGIVLGTPNYISPEVVLGRKYDGRADQYSLGITVYHALFGRAPMQGDNATATMINQTQKQLQLLSDIRSDVPRELALAVRKSIEKNPDKRFDTCEDFADAVIEGLRAPLNTSAAPATEWAAPEQSSQSSTRRRAPETGNASSRSSASKASGPSSASNISSRSGSSSSSGNASSRSGNSARSGSSSRSSKAPRRAVADPDLEWLEFAGDPAAVEDLPPKTGTPRPARARKSAKGKRSNTQIPGQDVHPALVVTLAVGVCLLLLSMVVRWAMTPSDVPPAVTENIGIDPAALSGSNHDGQTPEAREPKGKAGGGNKKDNKSGQPAAQPKPAETPATAVAANTAANRNKNKNKKPSAPAADSGQRPAGKSAAATTAENNPGPKPAAAQKPDLNLPFKPGDGITVGAPACPVVVVGNNVWNKATSAVSATLEGTYDGRSYTALSPDGRFFAAAAKLSNQQDTDVTVWDTNTGKRLFTAKGTSGRYADAILLSQKSLFVGGRWSQELQQWDCPAGNQRKAVPLSEGKFQRGNTAISHDGQFIAAVSNSQLGILQVAGGRPVGIMQSPPAGGGRSGSRQHAEAIELIYASLQSLEFSKDNTELAGLVTHPNPRVLCWNSAGELTHQDSLSIPETAIGSRGLEWFPDGTSWLVAGHIIDRESRRIVLSPRHHADGQYHIYDDFHLLGTFAAAPAKLVIKEIPWERIKASMAKADHPAAAHLAPSIPVSLNIDITGRDAAKTAAQTALAKRLRRDGFKITPDQKDLVVRITGKAGETKLVLQVLADRKTVFSRTLTDVAALGPNFESGGEPAKSELLEKLTEQIETVDMPWFIPQDDKLATLPLLLE
ncbi:MAG: serine/threonine-protein kinase [Fuerstiella sp.]